MSECEFIKMCDLSWEDLVPTGDAQCRYCTVCKQQVFMSHTEANTEMHSTLKHCIAIADDHDTMHRVGLIGETAAKMDWMRKLDYSIFLSSTAEKSTEKADFLQLILGKCVEQAVIESILVGERVYLFDLDREPALEFVKMMAASGFHAELIENQ